MTQCSPLTQQRSTPIYAIPAHIERPECAWKDEVQEGVGEPLVQTLEDIENVREISRIAANVLVEAGKAVAPGVTTDETDRVMHEYLLDHDTYPSTLGYRGFKEPYCIPLNETVCHGIPDTQVIEDGDIVNVGVTGYKNGVHGNTNVTLLAGSVSGEHHRLVEHTYDATMHDVKVIKPGRKISVIGCVIESYAKHFGYNTVRDFTGHGVGTTFHSSLIALHYDEPSQGTIFEPGTTSTVEPMINLGEPLYHIWDSGWIVRNDDFKFTAQFERTMLVTADGYEILILSDEQSVPDQFQTDWKPEA